jgi:glycosyltransferase involved in cell wall biosynthesis
MKISFDVQAFQSVNRIGGIGKYNHDFLTTLFQLYPDNEYTLIHNGPDKDKLTAPLVKFENVHSRVVRYFPGNDLNPLNQWLSLLDYRLGSADITHILSPFEPQRHTVIPNKLLPARTVITVYDFIPFIFKDLYLHSAIEEKLYMERIEILESADLMLAISEATRKDAINLFSVPPEKIVNIGIAPSDEYYKIDGSEDKLFLNIKKKYGIVGKFVLTVSNLDHRKNLSTLLEAFLSLPDYILSEYFLVIVTNSGPKHVADNKKISEILSRAGKAKIVFLYFLSDQDLCVLYNACDLFVYASLYEGGGLPVVEAMKCGAPVIASNTSSIPEYVGRKDNLFNPLDMKDIAHSMENILTDESFRKEIRDFGLEFSRSIRWENVVGRVMIAYKHVLSL